jgi:hypothetical protein
MDPLRGARYRDIADLRPNSAPLPQVGDWVTTYQQGIWQVYRVLTYVSLDPSTGSEKPQSAVFAKRIVSRALKRAFSETCCAPAFVHELDESATMQLTAFIRDNDAVYQQFIGYRPKPLDAIYNARIAMPPTADAAAVAALFPTDRLFTALEIEQHITDVGLDARRNRPAWTAQFVSPDHACADGHLVFRFNRVQTF